MRFEEFKEKKKLRKFAEGYRGLIYTYSEGGEKFAVKVPSEEKLKKAFLKEAQILEFLKSKGIKFVPQLVYKGEDFFVYRFIEGKPFKKFFENLNPQQKKFYLKKLILAAYCLDKLGIFKDEFQRPFTNVLVNGRKIYLLDFERGQLGKYWKNLPQLLQFLTAVGILNREEAIKLGREYKKNPKSVVKFLISTLNTFGFRQS